MWGTRAQGMTLAGLVASASLMAGMALAQAPQNPFAGECNRTATPEEVEGARGAHQAAKQYYERAEYAKAIQYWRDVFNFDCNAIGTLLNIANAYERLGDRKNAIFALEAYVKRVPEGTDVSKIQVRIENLKALLQAEPPPAPSASAAPPPSSASAAPPPPPPSATALPPPPLVKPYGVTPWVTVGAGAAVMVVGGILLPVGLGKDDACRNPSGDGKTFLCPTTADLDDAKLGQTLVPAAKIALGVGGAAVLGGLIWELVGNQPAPAQDKPTTGRRIRVSPSFGPGMTGATVHGTF